MEAIPFHRGVLLQQVFLTRLLRNVYCSPANSLIFQVDQLVQRLTVGEITCIRNSQLGRLPTWKHPYVAPLSLSENNLGEEGRVELDPTD